MSKLTTGERNNMPKSNFALPGKKAYPIEDKGHAQAALARVSEFGSPAEKQEVRSKVSDKFPSMGKNDGHHAKSANATHNGGKLRSTNKSMDNWGD